MMMEEWRAMVDVTTTSCRMRDLRVLDFDGKGMWIFAWVGRDFSRIEWVVRSRAGALG